VTNAAAQSTVKLSVCVITYNHGKYIAECLQSIVDQQTDFDFEVIVSDDCSTDGTQAIVREFAETFPSRIKAVLRPARLGGTKNYLLTHGLARGEYVAHMDGDDLMLPGKLAAQARYLDNYPEVVAVWHRVRTITGDGRVYDPPPAPRVERLSQRIVLRRGVAGHHSSLMYRRANKPGFSSFGEVLDLHISLELLKSGEGAILPAILGIYRKGVGVQTTDRSKHSKIVKDALDHYLAVYPQYSAEIDRLALSLFLRELIVHRRVSRLLLDTMAKTFSLRTPMSIASACLQLGREAVGRIFSRHA
jgi:glycosyltransferase involved in cell wall biosynthesis